MLHDTFCHSNGGQDEYGRKFKTDYSFINLNCPMYSFEGRMVLFRGLSGRRVIIILKKKRDSFFQLFWGVLQGAKSPPPRLAPGLHPKKFSGHELKCDFYTLFGDPKGVKPAFWPPSGRLDGVLPWRKLKIRVFLAILSDFERFWAFWVKPLKYHGHTGITFGVPASEES